jgi:hypothetical protein
MSTVPVTRPPAPDPPDGDGVWVLERALPELRARIEALSRRARLGTGQIALRELERRGDGRVRVRLDGEPPVLAGWTLVAIADRADSEPRYRSVPPHGQRVLAGRVPAGRCEHCHVRRRRRRTFLVWQQSSGVVREVGSSCLRDFLGGYEPARMIRQAEAIALAHNLLEEAERDGQDGADGEPVPTSQLAAHAARAVRVHGWKSRAQARTRGGRTTADDALQSLRERPDDPTVHDCELARAALVWARELLPLGKELSEFERDASAAAGRLMLHTAGERGLVCALVAIFRRRSSRHVGEVGDGLRTAVVVERIVADPSPRHGIVRRHDLVDAEGNRLAWWKTSPGTLPTDRAVTLEGRVERHTTFGPTAVTVLSRCGVVETLDR